MLDGNWRKWFGHVTSMEFSEIPNPKAAADAIKDFNRRFSAKVCLSASKDCNGPIVSAHTLSVGTMLRPISKHGKVYALRADLYAKTEDGPAKIALRGINETSVFNGFCAKHDKQLFAPIEDFRFTCSREQLFLYAYRAITKESYLKRKQAESMLSLETFREIHNLPKETDVQFSPEALLYQAASLRGAEEIERLKARLDQLYLTKDFSRLCTTIIPFGSVPGLVCNFVYAPDFDFKGNCLQDFTSFEQDLSALFVTVLPVNTGGFAIFSYLDTANSAPRKLIESLVSESDITSSLVWLIACQTENFALSPSWYEGLSQEQQQMFVSANLSNVNPFSADGMKINQLKECGISVTSWKPGTPFSM
jgi:hypothetical protein